MDTTHIGNLILPGAVLPAAALIAMRVDGISCIEAVLTTASIHISSVATPLRFDLEERIFIAFIPNGVAALDSPKKLATIFIDMARLQSESVRADLNKSFIKGDIKSEILSTNPDFSAIAIKPDHIDIIPPMDIRRSIALVPLSNSADIVASILPSTDAIMKETRIIEVHIILSIRKHLTIIIWWGV